MATSLTTLISDRTLDEEEALMLSTFQSQNFPVSDWLVGGVARTMLKAIANGLLDKSKLIKLIAQGGLVQLAKTMKDSAGVEIPDWLNLLGENFYDLTRVAATYTTQRCKVNCSTGLGPQNVTTGFVARNPLTGNRYIYQGTSPVTIPDGSFNFVTLTAESPGSKYSDAAGTITEIVTPLPGLSITNPATDFGGLDANGKLTKSATSAGTGTITPSGTPTIAKILKVEVTASGQAGTSGTVKFTATVDGAVTFSATVSPIPASYAGFGDGVTLTLANGAGTGYVIGDVHTCTALGSPITKQGSDAETNEVYASRCIGRWPSLAQNAIQDKYITWIKQCSLDNGFGIEKITLRPSATEAGVVDITLATGSGAPSGGTITTITNYVKARESIGEKSNIFGATNKNITLTGQVTVKLADIVAIKAAADENWRKYIAALPIGGDISTGTPGVVRLFELYQALMDAGAITLSSIQINGAATDFALLYNGTTNEVAVIPAGQEPSAALTWNTVA